MMAGGNPASGEQEPRGFYPTPWEATVALMRHYRFQGPVLEPCAGNYMMAAEIEAFGLPVTGTDIHPLDPRVKQRDIFTIKAKPGVDTMIDVITNPPFNLAEKIIRHTLTEIRPRTLALLLKSTYWQAKNRIPLFNEYMPAWALPLTWRLDFKGLGKPAMECTWFVWERGFNGPAPQIALLKKPETHGPLLV
jgi:hypothetical protein